MLPTLSPRLRVALEWGALVLLALSIGTAFAFYA